MNQSCNAQLAIATIPLQQADMKALHDKPEALDKGTIFPELCLPFFITETELKENNGNHICELKKKDEGTKLLIDIMETGFYLDDLALYLDNHPEDTEALNLYNQYDQEMKNLNNTFTKNYYPLSKGNIPEAKNSTKQFAWTDGPAPWEGVCV